MPEPREESFPGKCRLSQSNDFRRVFARGKRNATPYFVIYALPNQLAYPRLGIQVSRKTGSAVTRNYLKRIARDVFRKMKSELQPPVDLILIAQKAMTELDYRSFEASFRSSLQRFIQ